ncbi:MAG: hypothetical protein EBR09_17285, partial [Proteobacteria bacterium]|nr:hypothetical protein [Pseudomonadota bacterium]
MEGCLTVFAVLTSEYPAAQCICKLGQGEARRKLAKDSALARLCLGHENAAAQHAWTQDIEFRTDAAAAVTVCFAAMDGANARLRNAFDKALRRLYMLAQSAGQAADGTLAALTGDTVACDAFDVSPYVLSIIPEPIDYFMHCSDTADCRTRCLGEFEAFDAANRSVVLGAERPGVLAEVALPVESMLFGAKDVSEGRASPPFAVQDAAELAPAACAEVCGAADASDEPFPNRCVAVAGAARDGAGRALAASAYFCLPVDMTRFVHEWRAVAPAAQGYALEAGAGGAAEEVLAVHLLGTWGPQAARAEGVLARDALLAVVRATHAAGELGVRLLLLRPGFAARTVLRTAE